MLGIAHCGVLRAVDELGIKVDSVCGTSAGSLVGCLFCANFTGDEIQDIVTSQRLDKLLLDARFFLGIGSLRLLMPAVWSKRAKVITLLIVGLALLTALLLTKLLAKDVMTNAVSNILFVCLWAERLFLTLWGFILVTMFVWRPALLRGRKMDKWVNKTVRTRLRLKRDPICGDLAVPFRAVATDLRTGEVKYLDSSFDNSMTVGQMVRASAAIPFVFSPVTVGKLLLADGGITQNIPISAAVEHATGLDNVFIVAHFEPESIKPRRTDWFYHLLWALIEAARSVQITDVPRPHSQVKIALTVNLDPFDFAASPDRKTAAINKAYEDSKAILQANIAVLR